MNLKNYIYIYNNIAYNFFYSNLCKLKFFNYLIFYQQYYNNFYIKNAIKTVSINYNIPTTLTRTSQYKITLFCFELKSNNNTFYCYYYLNNNKGNNLSARSIFCKGKKFSTKRFVKLSNKVKFKLSYFFYKKLLRKSVRITNSTINHNNILMSRQKYFYFFLKKKGKKRYFKKRKFYLNYIHVFKSRGLVNELFYIYARGRKKPYNIKKNNNPLNLTLKNKYFHKEVFYLNKKINLFKNETTQKKKLNFIYLINSYLSLRTHIDKFSYYQKIFYFDSVLLVSYFTTLTNDICSLNYKYYRIHPSYGRRPYGFKLVNRKRFFFLRRRELHELYKIVIIAFKTSDINLLKTWIKNVFEYINFKKHKFLCYIIRFYFKRLFAVYKRYTACRGLYFRVKGKISVSGNARKRAFRVKLGLRSFSRKNLKIQYTDFFLLTGSGILGVKLLFSFQ